MPSALQLQRFETVLRGELKPAQCRSAGSYSVSPQRGGVSGRVSACIPDKPTRSHQRLWAAETVRETAAETSTRLYRPGPSPCSPPRTSPWPLAGAGPPPHYDTTIATTTTAAITNTTTL